MHGTGLRRLVYACVGDGMAERSGSSMTLPMTTTVTAARCSCGKARARVRHVQGSDFSTRVLRSWRCHKRWRTVRAAATRPSSGRPRSAPHRPPMSGTTSTSSISGSARRAECTCAGAPRWKVCLQRGTLPSRTDGRHHERSARPPSFPRNRRAVRFPTRNVREDPGDALDRPRSGARSVRRDRHCPVLVVRWRRQGVGPLTEAAWRAATDAGSAHGHSAGRA